jgi:hypothetical protein
VRRFMGDFPFSRTPPGCRYSARNTDVTTFEKLVPKPECREWKPRLPCSYEATRPFGKYRRLSMPQTSLMMDSMPKFIEI